MNPDELLTCPTCSTPDLDRVHDMCRHRNPLCISCCMGGEHDWRTDWHRPDDPDGGTAA